MSAVSRRRFAEYSARFKKDLRMEKNMNECEILDEELEAVCSFGSRR